MKVLVIGSSGMLGSSIASLDIDGIQFINSGRNGSEDKTVGTWSIDISIEKEVVRLIEEISPDYVINSAAYTMLTDAKKIQKGRICLMLSARKILPKHARLQDQR